MDAPNYAELHCLSNFSFLRGASHPAELVDEAAAQAYTALALTDECSLAGVVQAHQRAREHRLQLIIGTELQFDCGLRLVLLAMNASGYSQLCRLITHARRAAGKGHYRLRKGDIPPFFSDKGDTSPGCLALLLPREPLSCAANAEDACWLAELFPDCSWIAAELHRGPDDTQRLDELRNLAHESGLPLVAAGDVHMHRRERRLVQDTLTAVREGVPLFEAGYQLFPNGERHLRSRIRLAHVYPADLLRETLRIAARCTFSLDELVYRYPAEEVPAGISPAHHLRALTEEGLTRRWPAGTPEKVRALINKELALIESLGYEHYFLTVHEIVSWARARGILCQGRGSAANSSICFVLGITAVDPSEMNMLFERFVSKERDEPPDIDVDFEHERREEVLQHIYDKYGRHRAALAATVITYRPKSAIRDVGKALGLSLTDVDRIASALSWWDELDEFAERLRELGFDPEAPAIEKLLRIVRLIQHFPRHLSQHVGGFVISDRRLDELVPIENAAMADRTVIQWNKDDLDAIGLLKIDCLGLGMLTAIRKSFDLVEGYKGRRLSIDEIRKTEGLAESKKVYAMVQKADTVGVFQIESRAQMSMLPRLKPQCFYDLVIETAIVRPGPIQGGMVHPYLRRRQGKEPIDYPPRLERVLARTLGIPIFQEQVMEICIEAAGFSAGEADQVRRSMAAWRRSGGLEHLEQQLKSGMAHKGYTPEFADRIYQQILGFGEYGFPESHAASFALLVYVSAWLKCFEPAAFLAGILNSLPMGFYSPSQLIQDARRHGVTIRPADVLFSDWESTLEGLDQPAVRLGLDRIKGLREDTARRIISQRPFDDVNDLARRARLDERDRKLLARAGALATLSGDRHRAHWDIQGVEIPPGMLEELSPAEPETRLSVPREAQDIRADYESLGFTLGRHPLALLRPRLKRLGAISTGASNALANGRRCRIAGIVTNRQRPSTANGIIFMTLEDETGVANLVIRSQLLKKFRREVLSSRLILASGLMEHQDGVRHLMVQHLTDHSAMLGQLETRSQDFH